MKKGMLNGVFKGPSQQPGQPTLTPRRPVSARAVTTESRRSACLTGCKGPAGGQVSRLSGATVLLLVIPSLPDFYSVIISLVFTLVFVINYN